MDEIHRVALLGFTAFERSTLEASFRLASTRCPAYELIDAAERARVLVVDSDDAFACTASASRTHRCVHIGREGRVGELGHLKRPINTTSLLRLLDACVEHAPSLPPPPAVFAPPTPLRRMDSALVVDADESRLRFMTACLSRFGFEVHLARDGAEAQQRAESTALAFVFVFVDAALPVTDAYQTCRAIRLRAQARSQRTPVIAMCGEPGRMERLRSKMSGCDAYLERPLQHAALVELIGERIVSDMVVADTACAPLLSH